MVAYQRCLGLDWSLILTNQFGCLLALDFVEYDGKNWQLKPPFTM